MKTLSLLLAILPLALSAAPAVAATPVCVERASSNLCDADTDRIIDVIERQVCGTSTCATGREDRDGDGIPDWSEIVACGTARCADPGRDTDLDGMPDFAERFVCGTAICAGGREDLDADKIGDWVEFVICGDNTCANGSEDYDNDGVSDAKQLSACVVAYDVTGSAFIYLPPLKAQVTGGVLHVEVIWWWPLIVGAILALLGFGYFGVALYQQHRRDAEREPVGDPVDLETLFR